ncbi:hypothetical protein [Natrinema halophilum]|uniref:Major facilitator superfamily (MFS) profile domain-containing protein n=1 Tax=Natrinema halophilum TaxID=1699371 RepID=A0A7D5GLE8_9EURY|nr:hypothetical protein [Natrinema halophilum]QLG49412.1 hypothetical protein HYG82_11335 [Natrinema halophilum]
MDRGVRRRLDVLIVLVSGLLGLALTVIYVSERAGGFVLLISSFVTVCIAVSALWYAEG